MNSYGIFFAIDADAVRKLRFMEMSERPVYISEELEDMYLEDYPERTAEVEDCWEAVSRSLSGGILSFDTSEEYPLSGLVLGGEVLYYDDENNDYIITLKNHDEVCKLAESLEKLTKKDFKKGYDLIEDDYSGELSKEDFEQSWEYLCDVIPFFRYAAKNKLSVIFTADLY